MKRYFTLFAMLVSCSLVGAAQASTYSFDAELTHYEIGTVDENSEFVLDAFYPSSFDGIKSGEIFWDFSDEAYDSNTHGCSASVSGIGPASISDRLDPTVGSCSPPMGMGSYASWDIDGESGTLEFLFLHDNVGGPGDVWLEFLFFELTNVRSATDITATVAAMPLPGSLSLMLGALAGLYLRKKAGARRVMA